VSPIFVLITVELSQIVAQHVRQITLPAMAPLIAVQPVAQRLVGHALQVDVQRGVDAQAALVHGLGSVLFFQILANLFEEVRGQVVTRILDVQTKWQFLRRGFLGGRNFPLFGHASQDQVPAGQRQLRIQER